MQVHALTVSVNYDDILRLTLPRMVEHFDSVTVVTHPEDAATCAVAEKCGARLHLTEVFYEDGASFDKGRALDEGLAELPGACTMPDRGWACVVDADIYLPKSIDLTGIQPGVLYSPYRYLLVTPQSIPPEDIWPSLPKGPEYRSREFAGYFHLFHRADLRPPPWYASNQWTSARGCDSVFTFRWQAQKYKMRRLPFQVLHLGTPVVNWEGRVAGRWDEYDQANDIRPHRKSSA